MNVPTLVSVEWQGVSGQCCGIGGVVNMWVVSWDVQSVHPRHSRPSLRVLPAPTSFIVVPTGIPYHRLAASHRLVLHHSSPDIYYLYSSFL